MCVLGIFLPCASCEFVEFFFSVFSSPQRFVRTKLYDEQSRAMKTSVFHGLLCLLFFFLFPLLCSVNDHLLCSMFGRSFNCYGGYDSFVLIDSFFSMIYIICKQYTCHDSSSVN